MDEAEARANDPVALIAGQATYEVWRDWWQTELVITDELTTKLVNVPFAAQEAGRKAFGNDLAVPTTIAMGDDRRLSLWPTPDKSYAIKLPVPLMPYINDGNAGAFARKKAAPGAEPWPDDVAAASIEDGTFNRGPDRR